jgi:hypothetical protein
VRSASILVSFVAAATLLLWLVGYVLRALGQVGEWLVMAVGSLVMVVACVGLLRLLLYGFRDEVWPRLRDLWGGTSGLSAWTRLPIFTGRLALASLRGVIEACLDLGLGPLLGLYFFVFLPIWGGTQLLLEIARRADIRANEAVVFWLWTLVLVLLVAWLVVRTKLGAEPESLEDQIKGLRAENLKQERRSGSHATGRV